MANKDELGDKRFRKNEPFTNYTMVWRNGKNLTMHTYQQ